MTNEEFNARIDRLTERHEALAQTHELFVHDLEDIKLIVRANTELARILLTSQLKTEDTIRKHTKRIDDLEQQ